jgi:hypothetical protein
LYKSDEKVWGYPRRPRWGSSRRSPDPLVGISSLRLSNSRRLRRLDYLGPQPQKTSYAPGKICYYYVNCRILGITVEINFPEHERKSPRLSVVTTAPTPSTITVGALTLAITYPDSCLSVALSATPNNVNLRSCRYFIN